MRKFTHRREDGRAEYTGRRNEFALKGKAKIKEDDDEPLGIINVITGVLIPLRMIERKKKKVSKKLRP